jgi:uroporphyrinogen III methyltransferase/synthase
VKLRLLSARLSLLSRDQKTMASDLDAADDALARYFDPASKSTQTVRDLVSQVRHASTSVDLPNLNASLEAVHQYKSGD